MLHALSWSHHAVWPADAAVVLRLVVSELATNAVLHAATRFEVVLSRSDGALPGVSEVLRVAVPARCPRPPPGRTGGPGIVERLNRYATHRA